MGLNRESITRALTTVDGPRGEDLVTAGALRSVGVEGTDITIELCLGSETDRDTLGSLARQIDAVIRHHADRDSERVGRVRVKFVGGASPFEAEFPPPADHGGETTAAGAAGADGGTGPLPGVKHVIAVGAGKGGVGKSTVAVNLAVGLARAGRSVGLLDGDIYGPSLPTMLGLGALEQVVHEGELQPYTVHGIRAITLGKLVEADKPLIWRGPMAHGAFNQLITRTRWGELDHLIIDLPPGTGDVPLTMAQTLQLTGAVIVCTPQRVAQDDAVRAVRMFQQLNVEVLGVVENMSFFIGDDGKEYDIFGRGGAEQMAQRLGLPFLGAIPINTALRANGDAGAPARNFDPATAGGEALPTALGKLVETFNAQVSLAALKQGRATPTLSVS